MGEPAPIVGININPLINESSINNPLGLVEESGSLLNSYSEDIVGGRLNSQKITNREIANDLLKRHANADHQLNADQQLIDSVSKANFK